MDICLPGNFWNITVSVNPDGAVFAGGYFGEIEIRTSLIFRLQIENRGGKLYSLDSAAFWQSVEYHQENNTLRLAFRNPEGFEGVAVIVTGRKDVQGISWKTEVQNHSPEYSVAMISYPVPQICGETLNLFVPEGSGRALYDVGKYGFCRRDTYPGHLMTMQYFAWWGRKNGIYLGVHDSVACAKTFDIQAGDDLGKIDILFPAIGAGRAGNSFCVGGEMRWEFLDGDWYDATMRYGSFVHTCAQWLPQKGRPDTPAQFKEVPYWICDYIPNSEKQRDARPMVLSAVSERYGEDYWVEAAVELKNRLGTPVAYHIYNWHEIPFNINYPHFTPAREIAKSGMRKLKEAGLYVLPYINAVSWEMDDGDEGFLENFANTGIHGASVMDGDVVYIPYLQRKVTGEKTRLAPICPSYTRWHQIMERITREIESTLPVDGIYFDQVSAVPPIPCRNPEHNHLPGGGSYWVRGYQKMMESISVNKPKNAFYFSESNAEAYAKSFDGFLTWVWTQGQQVPAFPAIYAGYVQMVGRYTDGVNRDDDDFFRYHLAEGLLFGQQLGWINAHVIYDEKRMAFLEKMVHTRYAYTKLFCEGKLLRPPVVTTDVPAVISSGVSMPQVLSGAWQIEDKTVVFAINVSEQTAQTALRLYLEEYGKNCPREVNLTLKPMSIEIMEYSV